MKKQIYVFLTTLIITVNFLFFQSTSFAVTAYPYPVEITQLDGSKITILHKGDEKVKWAETSDGYSILFNKKGVYEYAIVDSKKDMIVSGIKAHDPSKRTTSEVSFLNNITKGLSYSYSQIGMMKSIWEMYDKILQNHFQQQVAESLYVF